jgi:hypothetical protein
MANAQISMPILKYGRRVYDTKLFGVAVVMALGTLALMGAGVKPVPALVTAIMIGELLIQGPQPLYGT